MCIVGTSGIAHDGAAIGRIDGKVHFIDGALPEETIKVVVSPSASKQRSTASITEIIKPNPRRRIPPCPEVGRCGGCPLQIADETLQSTLKTQIVADAMARIGRIDTPVSPMATVEQPFRYRNKGLFHVDDGAGRAQLGFFAKGTHELIPAAHCLLFSEQVNALTLWLEDAITATGQPGHIRKVMIRESAANGQLMVVFVTASQAFRMPGLVARLNEEWPAVKSIWHNINSNPKMMLGTAMHHLAGAKTIEDAIGPLQCKISPAAFLQVNNAQAAHLYETARQFSALQADDHLLDLYCGAGTIGLYMADSVRQVIGVESNAAAVRDAKENARNAGVKNIKFHAAKAEQWLPKWQKEGGHADIAIVDPPRKGLDARLIDALIQADIKRITYISCNPSTCARDLAIFQRNGYAIKAIQPIDLFPQTSHVETVVLLSKLDAAQHINVEINMEEMDLTASESKPTYEKIKNFILEKHKQKVSSLYISQTKRKYGLKVGKNYNLSKSENAKVPQCPPEKEEVILDALKHFKMI